VGREPLRFRATFDGFGLDTEPVRGHLALTMSDENSNPLKDVRDGVGLLFRAAKWAVNKLPTDSVEEVVRTSAREGGRAVRNVAATIEREVRGGSHPAGREETPSHPADEPPSGPKPRV